MIERGDRVLVMEQYGFGLGAEDIGAVEIVGVGPERWNMLWVRFQPDGKLFAIDKYAVLQLPYPKEAK